MAKMMKCKTCGEEIAKSAKACPHCGAKNKKPFAALRIIFGILLIIWVAGAINRGFSGSGVSDRVTKEEFEVLYTGMTYSQVVKVVGFDGELGSQVGIGAGVGNEYNTELYTWSNPDGSNMNATFQGGGLVSKAQYGLK